MKFKHLEEKYKIEYKRLVNMLLKKTVPAVLKVFLDLMEIFKICWKAFSDTDELSKWQKCLKKSNFVSFEKKQESLSASSIKQNDRAKRKCN